MTSEFSVNFQYAKENCTTLFRLRLKTLSLITSNVHVGAAFTMFKKSAVHESVVHSQRKDCCT